MMSSTIDSSLARVNFLTRCFGPPASAVMNGRLISVSMVVESSIFARSAASRRRCNAISFPLPRRSRPGERLREHVPAAFVFREIKKIYLPVHVKLQFQSPLGSKKRLEKTSHGFSQISWTLDPMMIRANPWPSSLLFLLLVLYIYVLRIYYAFVLFGVAVCRCFWSRSRAWTGSRRALRWLGCLVHLLGQFVRVLRQGLAGFFHGCFVAAF